VHLQREYRRLRSTTLKKLLATTRCGAAMADGVATIPSSVRTAHGADFRINWPRPCKARARGGKLRALWRRNSLRKRLRFARNGGPHRNARRIGGRCLSDRDSFVQAYIVSILLLFFCVNLHWKEVGTPPHVIKTACAKFRKHHHPNSTPLLT